MEPESSSPYSQVPAICPYPEPTPSSLHPLPLPEDHVPPSMSATKFHTHRGQRAELYIGLPYRFVYRIIIQRNNKVSKS